LIVLLVEGAPSLLFALPSELRLEALHEAPERWVVLLSAQSATASCTVCHRLIDFSIFVKYIQLLDKKEVQSMELPQDQTIHIGDIVQEIYYGRFGRVVDVFLHLADPYQDFSLSYWMYVCHIEGSDKVYMCSTTDLSLVSAIKLLP
jgi:hypothetical protein